MMHTLKPRLIAAVVAVTFGNAAYAQDPSFYTGAVGSAFDAATLQPNMNTDGTEGVRVTFVYDPAALADAGWQNFGIANDCNTRIGVSKVDVGAAGKDSNLTFNYEKFYCAQKPVVICESFSCIDKSEELATPLFHEELNVDAAISFETNQHGVIARMSDFTVNGEAPNQFIRALAEANTTGGWDVEVVNLSSDWAGLQGDVNWTAPEVHLRADKLHVTYFATSGTSDVATMDALSDRIGKALLVQGLYPAAKQ